MAFFNFLRSLVLRVFCPVSGIRERYAAFKDLLEFDHICHSRMARIEMIHYDRKPVDFCAVKMACEEMSHALESMVDRLEVMAPRRYPNLRDSVAGINEEIRRFLTVESVETGPPYVLMLDEVFSASDMTVGGKARNLGVILRELGLPVPKGFAVASGAFQLFIEANGLRRKIDTVLANLDARSIASVDAASREITELFRQSPVPPELEAALLDAYSRVFGGELCAVRSSAAAEDSSVSFAGIYKSVLAVAKEDIPAAYKEVIASKYSSSALSYRIHSGLLDQETPMAVLVLGMVDARASGIIYTADPVISNSDRVIIYAIRGLGESLVGGATAPDVIEVSKKEPNAIHAVCKLSGPGKGCGPKGESRGGEGISEEEGLPVNTGVALQLARWGLDLESFFGHPLDVEWCQDQDGRLYLLQARPLGIESPHDESLDIDASTVTNAVLFGAGERASSGVGAGPVFKILSLAELKDVPEGCVLVAPTTSPRIVQVLSRLKAVVTDTGSVAGHLASVAREWGIPALVNTRIATEVLHTGDMVTVDADRQRVLEGVAEDLLALTGKGRRPGAKEETPFTVRLRRILEHVSRLSLTNPDAPDFLPENCRTVHDVLRFVHEKAVAEMFSLGEAGKRRIREAKRLSCDIPLVLYALDLGDGFAAGSAFRKEITPEEIRSVPFQALWQGMTDSWDTWESGLVHLDWGSLDRMTSGEGIVSVDSQLLASFALVSQDYLNLNVKFGFHFTVVDTLCGGVQRENYISMRFEGGGGSAEGRSLRALFIKEVLEKEGFVVQLERDSVYASINRITLKDCQDKLDAMGRLLSVTRLLDMSLTSVDQVDAMVADFEAKNNDSRARRKASRAASAGGGIGGESGGEPLIYPMTWITTQLAVGHAPTSYEELESIKQQGIDAIVNLCGEYCDLHQIEKDYGFEVRYLPIADDEAPEMEPVEQALAWLDETIYLNRKVLIHCRLGIGRTGTFVRSYLLRRGFGPKLTEEKLQKIRSHPTSFNQWRFLRKYGKKEGRLTVREPSLEGEHPVNLDPFFAEYENLSQAADLAFKASMALCPDLGRCGRDTDQCCYEPFNIQFVEAIYLYHHMNRELSRELRLRAIEQARIMGRVLQARTGGEEDLVVPVSTLLAAEENTPRVADVSTVRFRCPLSFEGKCVLFDQRPIRCRVFGMAEQTCVTRLSEGTGESGEEASAPSFPLNQVGRELYDISRRLFLGLNGSFLEGKSLLFSLPHVVSGRFIQDYFEVLAGMEREER